MPIARESQVHREPEVRRDRPMRTCVGCRVSSAQEDLLRLHLVAKDEGAHRVEPAISRRARTGPTGPTGPTGRCAYLCPRRSCLDQAIKRRAFTRAFSSRTSSPGTPGIESMDSSAADALWTCAIAQLRREIQLLDRSSALSSRPETRAENAHAQSRRRGLERLLSELSCAPIPPVRPTPIDRRPRLDGQANGQGGTPTHG